MLKKYLTLKLLTLITIGLGLATASQTLAEKAFIQPGSTQQPIEGPYTTNVEAGEFFQLGVRYYGQGDFERAETSMLEALRFDPSMAMAYHILGNALLQQHKSEEAVAEYRQAVRLDPKLVDGYNNLGVALYRFGRYEDAIAAYDQAIALNPKLADAYFNLGIVYQQSEESNLAILNLQKAKYFYQEEDNLAKASEVNIYIQCNIVPKLFGRKPAFPEVCPKIFTVTTTGIMR